MLSFGRQHRYYVYNGSVDMRKSFNGLHGLVINHLKVDAMNGDVFVFFNARRTQLKMLVWDGDGFLLLYKRLERGTFEFMAANKGEEASKGKVVSWEELQLILAGVSLQSVRWRKRYKRA